jgi:TetR/AcrR family transcriptional regulator, repressor for neighboring sulfatase
MPAPPPQPASSGSPDPRAPVPRRAVPPALAARLAAGDDPSASAAILQAAVELMAERSPSAVSLREIAERAGVNYGMIHRHYGTKERLLVEIFQLFTDYGADHIRASGTIDEAIERTFTIDAGGFARILAWVALDGVAPERTFADTSGMAVFQSLIEQGWETDGPPAARRERFDPRVVSSVVMLLITVWEFYAPYMQQVDDFGDRDLADVKVEVLELLRTLVAASAPAARAEPAAPATPSPRAPRRRP